METAFVSLICVALMVIGGMTMSQGFLSSMDRTSNNIETISQRDEEIMRTNIVVVEASQPTADSLKVVLRDSGQTKLGNFNRWDLIIHFRDINGQDRVNWFPYVESVPAYNQWSISGFYLNAGTYSPEVFEPGILNPEEEMVITCRIDPSVEPASVNRISIATPNGITATKIFTGYIPPP
jgi:hypothetical protein